MTTDQLNATTLAQVLDEPEVALLAQVLRLLGPERTVDALAEALTREAAGGMRTKDGARRKTSGGVFFSIVKSRCSLEEKRQLFPYQPALAPQRARPWKSNVSQAQIRIPSSQPRT
jgi:hypothetical protein